MALNPAKVAQAAKINEAIAALEAKRAPLMEHIRTEGKGTQVIEHKGEQYVVKTTPKTELDKARFLSLHPFSSHPQFYKTDPVFSATLVKADDRKGFEIPGTTNVTLTRVEKDDED